MGVSTASMTRLGVSLSNGLVGFAGGLFCQSQGSADIGMGIGTIIAGLVSVIVGENLIKSRKLFWIMFSVVLGSLVYRLAIGMALTLDTGEAWYNPKASDLNLLTAVIVVAFIALPKMKKKRGAS
jgi:putative ABC transport system permease protein